MNTEARTGSSFDDQVYYKEYQIEEIINNWNEIQAFKEKISSAPSSVGSYHSKDESEWKQQPGHTLWDLTPKTTRVPGNPRKRIEEICCMTADIEYFRQWLTIE